MPAPDLIELRPEGLYCPAGDFHIDPWRPVRRAVTTHGHSDHARLGMGEYHAAAEGAGILRWRLGDIPLVEHGYGEPFDLGGVRVSLHPAGHVLGSAQLRIEQGERVWVASGDYKRQPDPTCAAFEVVPCEVFVTEATFALPVYRWDDTPKVAREILDWQAECAARGVAAVLLCYALGKAQRLLAELGALSAQKLWLHGAMVPGVETYRAAGIALPETRAVSDIDKREDSAGALVFAPPSAAGTPWLRRFRGAELGFASGWMRVRGNRRRRGMERGFVVSDHADWPGLLQTVAGTGARRVIATHGEPTALIRHLRERGVMAETFRTPFDSGD
jgi:putative mRNA 3-end processing factor